MTLVSSGWISEFDEPNWDFFMKEDKTRCEKGKGEEWITFIDNWNSTL